MKCNACQDFDGEPVHEIQQNGRVTPQCPKCSNVMAAPERAPVTPSLDILNPATTTSATDLVRMSLLATPTAPGDIVATVKARIAAIDAQLVTMRKLETERAKLARMLAAAEPEDN